MSISRSLAAAVTGVALVAAGTISLAQTPAAAPGSREQLLEAQMKDEKSGSAEAGRPVFEKLCAGCHRFGAIGKDVGPDLTTLTSRFKRRDILESILWPSKNISDQYQAEMIELSDGSVVTGMLVRENATALLIRTGENPDKPVVVTKARVANRVTSAVSLMPEGLIDALPPDQIASLLAFVSAPAPEK